MSNREYYEMCLSGWAEMYVSGYWTAAEYISHVDHMGRVLCGLN